MLILVSGIWIRVVTPITPTYGYRWGQRLFSGTGNRTLTCALRSVKWMDEQWMISGLVRSGSLALAFSVAPPAPPRLRPYKFYSQIIGVFDCSPTERCPHNGPPDEFTSTLHDSNLGEQAESTHNDEQIGQRHRSFPLYIVRRSLGDKCWCNYSR